MNVSLLQLIDGTVVRKELKELLLKVYTNSEFADCNFMPTEDDILKLKNQLQEDYENSELSTIKINLFVDSEYNKGQKLSSFVDACSNFLQMVGWIKFISRLVHEDSMKKRFKELLKSKYGVEKND